MDSFIRKVYISLLGNVLLPNYLLHPLRIPIPLIFDPFVAKYV